MQIAKQNKIDPGFWIGLILIALFLYMSTKCK